VPISYDNKVTEPQALVLFVIWQAKQRAKKAKIAGKTRGASPASSAPAGSSDGLTNVQIHEAIEAEYTRLGKGKKGTSFANIKKIIETLEEWRPTPLLDAAAREGKASIVYRLSKDMVRWATTAAMLLQLETDIDGPILRPGFVQLVLDREMKNPDGTEFSRDQIEQALDFCGDMAFPYVSQDKNGFITTTPRVDSEGRFLALIQHP
jgi:hypothetical protein